MTFVLRSRFRGHRGDEGSTQILMALAMICALGLTLLAIQVAQANDMRTRSQTGADSAAIAALTPLRDAAIAAAQEGFDPTGIGLWSVEPNPHADNPVYQRKAAEYAAKNGMELVGDVHVTGQRGDTMKVSVQTKECVLKKADELTAKDRDDLAHGRNLCTDNQGKTGIPKGRGSAEAIARLKMPACSYDYDRTQPGEDQAGIVPVKLTCGGTVVWRLGSTVSREEILRVFKIRLVAEEDPTPYTGIPYADGPPGLAFPVGPPPPANGPFGERVVAWAMRWLGTPYLWGGGNPNGPTSGCAHGFCGTGFDCSGLTLYAIYNASGGKILLGHYTGNQYKDPRGKFVSSESDLQPGDLVFFNPGLHHVAIYIGGGKVVHAPQTFDHVKVSELSGFSGFAGGMRFYG